MALNIDTQDLVNYPGTVKRVTLDVDSIVPSGYEGDEKIVLTASTTAYSDNTNRTAIQDVYITDFKAGWAKSSGFAGTNGKFSLSSSAYKMMVKIDNTASGTDGNGYYEIELDYNMDSTPISGDAVAADMEEKIRAVSLDTADSGYSLSYLNASVYYSDGKFYIVSGSVSQYYTGSNRSSVAVKAGSTNDCLATLGFDIAMTSEDMAAISAKETSLNSNYTTDTATMTLTSSIGAAAGDALMITDGSNTDYFTAMSGTSGTTIKVPTNASNSYVGVSNSYTVSGTKVQLLREQDPDGRPTAYYTDVDAIGRWAVKTLVNQIDYSS